MNEELNKLLEHLDEKAMSDDLTQYDEGVRDLLIAIQGGDTASFVAEMLED